MTHIRTRWLWLGALAGVVVVLAIPVGGQTIGGRFLASLRIAKPKAVSAAAPISGTSRQLENVVAGILAETTTVSAQEQDSTVGTIADGSRIAGFRVVVPAARNDPPSVELRGAERATVRVNAAQLRTLFMEAGQSAAVPASVDDATATLSRPRGVQVRYGHCPAATPATIQSQLQGPPPPSVENADCIILTETPLATLTIPPSLDTAAVMEIALELSGMSPNQAHDFRKLFDWRAALDIAPPRAMRSYELTQVNSSPAMLMISAGRREPGYLLAWVNGGIVYSLAGYGSSGDAGPLAASIPQ